MRLLIPESLLPQKDRRRIKNGDFAPLAACPFLMMNRQEDISGVIGNAFFDRYGLVPKIAVASGDMETILDLCLAGEGACFCSKELAAKIFGGRDDSHLLQIPPGRKLLHPCRMAEKALYPKGAAGFRESVRNDCTVTKKLRETFAVSRSFFIPDCMLLNACDDDPDGISC